MKFRINTCLLKALAAVVAMQQCPFAVRAEGGLNMPGESEVKFVQTSNFDGPRRLEIARLRGMLERAPSNAELWSRLGFIYLRQGEIEEALDALKHSAVCQKSTNQNLNQLIAGCQKSLDQDIEKSKSFELQITGLFWRIHSDENAANAVCQLLVHNRDSVQALIPLVGTLGKGGAGFDSPIYSSAAGDPCCGCGGDFASVRYEWTRTDGSSALSGKYDLSQGSILLPPSGDAVLLVPICIPSSPGTYKLVIQLDNRAVRSAVNSNNIGRYLLLNALAQANVNVPQSEQPNNK